MLKIWGRSSSSNVQKVLWCCAELDIAYERTDWGGPFGGNQDPEYLKLNPNGLVPTVIDGDLVMWESNTICRYLAARDARTDLLPSAPAARAVVEQWMDWQAGELNNAWRYAFMAHVRKSPAHADPASIKASVASWNRHMALLDERLERTGAWVAGAAFTLADIVIGLAVHRFMRTPIERATLPAVDAYYDRLRERPASMPHIADDVP